MTAVPVGLLPGAALLVCAVVIFVLGVRQYRQHHTGRAFMWLSGALIPIAAAQVVYTLIHPGR